MSFDEMATKENVYQIETSFVFIEHSTKKNRQEKPTFVQNLCEILWKASIDLDLLFHILVDSMDFEVFLAEFVRHQHTRNTHLHKNT